MTCHDQNAKQSADKSSSNLQYNGKQPKNLAFNLSLGFFEISRSPLEKVTILGQKMLNMR
jgi:hypothetical protein